ncbi:cytochrome c [Shimwellia blattae]|nr:cytochrome c [Shimwellia blattae]GAB80184.1 putative cytochrome [Shimwellia blattae DSM 4481 = NBRC 105725]VDY64076.1 Alcohol dehydrogenase cytochrome c subunit precursor [Shimwellia blattae]VEC22208.1 Alcohol dehydrogenase cytochrome c subunit precursor [Shimwellia blattae]
MKIKNRLGHLVSLALFTFFSVCQQASAAGNAPEQSLLARGEWVARAADCVACHQGSGPGASGLSGGKAISTPMGDIIATNITPSEQYGIGRYTEAQFKQAVTRGIRADGSRLYPAMPYTAYQGMRDADIHALWVWINHAVPAVDKAAPQTALAFPWSVRPLMGIWNLFNNTPPAPAVPLATPELQRGYYLTEVLGHCSACHSPRNTLMGESSTRRLSGGDQNGWHAPNITSDPVSGIGGWSDQQLVQYLKTGNTPGKGVAAGGMGEVIEHSLSHLSDDDLQAIATWLRQIPPVRQDNETLAAWTHPQTSRDITTQTAGKALYESACAACHRAGGEGAYDNRFPSLTQNSTVGSLNPSNLVMTILDGVHREGDFVSTSMPAFRNALNDAQIADVTNYITAQFGDGKTRVTPAFVAQQRQGGERPLSVVLMGMAPWLLLAIVVILFAVWLLRRKNARHHSRG